MHYGKRPVFLLGHGVRAAGASHLVPALLEIGIPVLTSWQAKDLVDSTHPMYFGSPGIYGQRCANKVLYEADTVIAVGNRLAIWNVGFEGLRPDQKLIQVDIDEAEIKEGAEAHITDARAWIESVLHERVSCPDWIACCTGWREDHPWVEAQTHQDKNGYINSYRFVDALHEYLRPDEVIVTDMGTALICAHQVLKLKPPQRIMTSGGLGEMGCALPAAVGASFARDKGEVLCLSCDGGMMMNLQELQTIVHHKLPVKIIVFSNDGYLMIKHTQKVLGQKRVGVSTSTGVSCPKFHKMAYAFDMHAGYIRDWPDFYRIMPQFFSHKGPAMIEFFMDPEQPLVPKLNPIRENGQIRSPRFCDLSP